MRLPVTSLGGRSGLRAPLEQDPDIDGVFCSSDLLATGDNPLHLNPLKGKTRGPRIPAEFGACSQDELLNLFKVSTGDSWVARSWGPVSKWTEETALASASATVSADCQ